MPTDELSKGDQAGRKGAFSIAIMFYLPLLLFLCMSEFAFIGHVWLNPKLAVDFVIKICLQFMILIPAVGGFCKDLKLLWGGAGVRGDADHASTVRFSWPQAAKMSRPRGWRM